MVQQRELTLINSFSSFLSVNPTMFSSFTCPRRPPPPPSPPPPPGPPPLSFFPFSSTLTPVVGSWESFFLDLNANFFFGNSAFSLVLTSWTS